MDPLTAIGLLASLSNLIQASNGLLNVAKSFKDGDKELRELLTDVSVFAEALKGFNRVLRSRQTKHHISAGIIQGALDEAFVTVQELESKLVQMSKSEVSAVRRMKWVQHKSSLKKLHERLKAQSIMLQSFLTIAHAETYFTACIQHPQLFEISSYSAVANQDATSSLEATTSSEITLLPQLTLTSSVPTASVNSSNSCPESSGSSLQKTSSTSSEQARPKPRWGDSYTNEPTIRKACRYDCICECHEQSATTKKRLSRGNSNRPSCTDPRCHAVASNEASTVLPSKFFHKVLSQVMSSKSIKVRYDLKTFRMVSEGSDAMRYVKYGNLDKLKMCIESGEATLWDTAPDGWSLLHTAAYNRQLSIVKYLLELGAETQVADVGSRKPADLAILKTLTNDATNAEREMVEIFTRRDDYITDFEFTPIHMAVLGLYDPEDNERPTLEQLIETVDDCNNAPAGTDWDKWKSKYRRRSPLFSDIVELFRASAFGKPKTHKIIYNLLDQKDRKFSWTPLHWASSAGQYEMLKVLVNHGADPFILSNLDANILHAAAESKTVRGLEGALDIWRLYPRQLDINQVNRWGETPLHVAAWGSVGCVAKLLEAGAARDVAQEDQQIPLHCAGLSNRGEIRCKILALLCGGNEDPHVNVQDVDGRSPIFDFLNDSECVQVLIDHDARLDLLDNGGKSVFHHACILNEDRTLKTLLQSLPSESTMVTTKDADENTALVYALRHESIECATTLLELADVGDIVGQDGWALIHYAAKLGNVDVLGAVLQHPSFIKGMKTIDDKTAEVVAMEAGNWSGEVKILLRKYNSIA